MSELYKCVIDFAEPADATPRTWTMTINFPMRTITDHKINGLNEALEVTALDKPGPGGANHLYGIDVIGGAPDSGGMRTVIQFQNGPIKEAGVNGLTNEALLAIVIDRLRGFQHRRNPDGTFLIGLPMGDYACPENAMALENLKEALQWLKVRTMDRAARGVEGTYAI